MSTDVCFLQCHDYVFKWTLVEEPELCIQHNPEFSRIIHSCLQVCDDTPGSPQPDNIDVTVFDPSKNLRIPFNLKSTDTTDILAQKYLQVRPELGKNVHLVFNGKPVPAQKCLRDLGVKPGATFITYQKCIGG